MKKDTNKILLIAGLAIGTAIFSLGLLMLFLPKSFVTALATVIICLSIAGGMIMFPLFQFFLLGLMGGILMLIIPAPASGITLMFIGAVICAASPIVCIKLGSAQSAK